MKARVVSRFADIILSNGRGTDNIQNTERTLQQLKVSNHHEGKTPFSNIAFDLCQSRCRFTN
jgi:hypothetical protein